MPLDPAESLHAAKVRKQVARRRVCRMANTHRWWPLHAPWEVGDGPALTLCLNCGDVMALQAVMPSYPRPRHTTTQPS